MVSEEDKVERIQKKNSSDQGTIWQRKVDKCLANPVRENVSVCYEIALELSVQGVIAWPSLQETTARPKLRTQSTKTFRG